MKKQGLDASLKILRRLGADLHIGNRKQSTPNEFAHFYQSARNYLIKRFKPTQGGNQG